MTKEDIIRMAIEAGWDAHHAEFDTRIQTFAALVASAEREACIAHAMTSAEKAIDVAIKLEREVCAKEAERTFYSVQAAENIRARGQE